MLLTHNDYVCICTYYYPVFYSSLVSSCMFNNAGHLGREDVTPHTAVKAEIGLQQAQLVFDSSQVASPHTETCELLWQTIVLWLLYRQPHSADECWCAHVWEGYVWVHLTSMTQRRPAGHGIAHDCAFSFKSMKGLSTLHGNDCSEDFRIYSVDVTHTIGRLSIPGTMCMVIVGSTLIWSKVIIHKR